MIAYRVSVIETVENEDGTTTETVVPAARDADTFRVPSRSSADGTAKTRGYLAQDYTIPDVPRAVRGWERLLDKRTAHWEPLACGREGTREYRVYAPVAIHIQLARCEHLAVHNEDGTVGRYYPTAPLRHMT